MKLLEAVTQLIASSRKWKYIHKVEKIKQS